MLPFPIMSSTPVLGDRVLLDVDFTNQPYGSTNLTDASGNNIFTKSGSGSSAVTVDPVKGNVMTFGGSASYLTPMKDIIKLSNKHFTLQVVFKSTISTENMVFSTGDYYSAGAIVGGMLMTLFNNTGSQLFCTTQAGVFQRCLFQYSVNTWRDLTFEWNPITKIMTIKDNDTSTIINSTSIPDGFGDGNYFCIGASYVRGNIASFQGSIKKIKVLEIFN